jgi:hypothetical protein
VRLSQETFAGTEYGDTNLHWQSVGLSVTGALPLPGDELRVATSASTTLLVPTVGGSQRFLSPPGAHNAPLEELLDSALGLGSRLELGHGFRLTASAGLSARHELGAEFTSAIATGGSLALDYRRADWLRVRVGAGLGMGIDRARLAATPVFRLRLRIHPQIWLETDATSGSIEWALSQRLYLRVFGGVDSKRYRLSKRSGRLGAGSIELRRSEVGIGIESRIGQSLRLTIGAIVVLGSHLSLLDENRKTIDARDTREPAGALQISFEWRPLKPTGLEAEAR